MQWCFVVKSNSAYLAASCLVLAGVAAVLMSYAPTVQAIDTEIGVALCGSNVPAATISINEPMSDSVISREQVTFRGSVSNVTQLDVSIDGQYNNTISIPASGTTFEFDLTVPLGTHTITTSANALCGGQSASRSIVLTYQPAVEPSNGTTTPTTLDEQQAGVLISEEPIIRDETADAVERIPIISNIINRAFDIFDSLGLETTVASGATTAPTVLGVARVGLTIVAVTSVVMASTLAPVALQAVPGVSEVFHMGTHRSLIYLEWVIRGVGLLAMTIAYFL